jgi:NitT/TauT family transport system substrate-binding protein
MTRRSVRWLVGLATTLLVGGALPTGSAWAEANRVHLAISPGFGFLPIYMVIDKHLIEQHARAAGLGEVTVEVSNLTGGAAQNDALLAGAVDLVTSGVPPFLVLWDRTRGHADVKALFSVDSMPLYLNTRNPAVRTIADLTAADRIALASPTVGPHATVLEMATAKLYGMANYKKFDALTVGMSQPDGMIALLSGKSEVDSHFTVPPYQYLELEHPDVHRLLSSYDVLGSPSTFMMAWTTTRFRKENPILTAAIYAAASDAVAMIKQDKASAADTYLRMTKDKIPPEKLMAMLSDPEVQFTLVPQNVMRQANFMADAGIIRTRPTSWKELFFPEAQDLPGS